MADEECAVACEVKVHEIGMESGGVVNHPWIVRFKGFVNIFAHPYREIPKLGKFFGCRKVITDWSIPYILPTPIPIEIDVSRTDPVEVGGVPSMETDEYVIWADAK